MFYRDVGTWEERRVPVVDRRDVRKRKGRALRARRVDELEKTNRMHGRGRIL